MEAEGGQEWERRAEEREGALRAVRGQLAVQVEEVRRLKEGINCVQEKYHSLLEEQEEQAVQAQWEHSRLQQSRLSAEYERGNGQAAISVLREENAELQRIFSAELERRNEIIRELMAEKRALYGQLVGREDAL